MYRNAVREMALFGLCFAYITVGEVAAGERLGAADSNIVISVLQPTKEGMYLQIDYPVVFTSRLDIYISTNLQSGTWMLGDTNLSTTGNNTLAWIDSATVSLGRRFYRVGNADLDTDLDGLADVRETLIYLTNPLVPDTDSDGIPDGAELQRGTDPVAGGSSVITLYADSDAGADGYDGYAPEVTAGHGPKRSLSAAANVSYSRDVIQLSGLGVFHEPSLWIGTSDVTLRPLGAVCVQP